MRNKISSRLRLSLFTMLLALGMSSAAFGAATIVTMTAVFGILHSAIVPTLATPAAIFPLSNRAAHEFATLSWIDYMRTAPDWSRHDPATELRKLPTLLGLGLLIVFGLIAPARRARVGTIERYRTM